MARAGAVWIDVLPNMALFGRTVAAESKLSLAGIGSKTGTEYGTSLARAAKRGMGGLGASVGAEMKLASAQAAAAVQEASAKIAVARDREAKAAGAVRVAELKLKELRDSGKASASQLAAAEERLATAERGTASAARGTVTATKEMTLAQERAAAVATATATETAAAAGGMRGFAAKGAAGLGSLSSKMGETLKTGAKLGGLFAGFEVAKFIGSSVKAAGDFQAQTNVLVTAAGETTANLKTVRKGILDISSGTGTDWKNVTEGMYQIEKAGYRGADGLLILKAAAQGAKEEGAQLDTVTNAMTSVMASYHLGADKSVNVMNAMKTAAGEAKTTMELFSGSLSTVLPLASANKISFGDIAGSLASLTQHGTSADQAAQELAFTMRGLAAPNMVAQKEMQNLGLDAQDVSKKLGDGPGGRGLAGTLNYLSGVVLHKMGPSGKALLNVFNTSKAAAQDSAVMMAKMSPATQQLAKDYAANKGSVGGFTKAIKDLDPNQANMIKQWITMHNRATGFNSALKNGMPGAHTYSDAIKKMTGGAAGLNTTLQLTGESTKGTKDRIDKINGSFKDGGKNVEGWVSTQKTFNNQMDRLKTKVENAGISLATKLLPGLTNIAGGLLDGANKAVDFGSKNQKWLGPLAGIILGIAAAYKVYTIGVGIATTVTRILNTSMKANLFGIILTLIMAAAAGLIYFYNHSKTFRTIVNGAFSAVGKAASFMWNSVMKPAFKAIVGAFLDLAGAIVHGAASAFGWVPGLGPKLKSAARHFDEFKANVNASLNGISEKQLHVAVDFKTGGSTALSGVKNKLNAGGGGSMMGRANGGPVWGPGTETSDSIPTLLSNNEHVLSAAEVKAAGGHGAVAAWRKKLLRRANGGPVVHADTPSRASIDAATSSGFLAFSRAHEKSLISNLGGGSGNPGGAGVRRWAQTIMQALVMNGLNPTPALISAWLRQVATESGGNAGITQQIHDVNSGGNEARGLLQVIPPTFRANAFPGHGNIFSGLDNALAAIHYAIGRYGSNMLGVIGHGHGYANGTKSATPGYHWVGEKGPELMRFKGGETVLTHSQSVAATKAETHTKAYLELGTFIGKSLAAGMAGTRSQITSTTKSLMTDIARVYTARVRTTDSATVTTLRAEIKKLQPLVSAHQKAINAVVAARKHLADLQASHVHSKAHTNALATAKRHLASANHTLTASTHGRARTASRQVVKLQSELNATMAHEKRAADIGYAAATTAMKHFDAMTKQAGHLADQRAAVSKKLAASQTKLADAVKLRNDFAASVRDQAKAMGDVTKMASATSRYLGGKDIVANMSTQLAHLKTFQADMAKLKALGLNNTAYQQIVEQGADGGGLDTAAGLLSGGKSVIGQVNSLQSQIGSTGKSFGDQSSKVLYQAGVNSATGLVKGLTSQEHRLEAASKHLASVMVKSIKKALGIKSPSRVMADEVGRFIPHGIIAGSEAERPALDKHMQSLVPVPTGSIRGRSSAAGSGGTRLHPADIQALAAAMSNVSLELDGRGVSRSVDRRLGQMR